MAGEEGEEPPLGRQQQQQSSRACPSERRRKSMKKGVRAQRRKSRNWPRSPRAEGRSSALRWAGR